VTNETLSIQEKLAEARRLQAEAEAELNAPIEVEGTNKRNVAEYKRIAKQLQQCDAFLADEQPCWETEAGLQVRSLVNKHPCCGAMMTAVTLLVRKKMPDLLAEARQDLQDQLDDLATRLNDPEPETESELEGD